MLTRRASHPVARLRPLAAVVLAAGVVGCQQNDPAANQPSDRYHCVAVSSPQVAVSPPVANVQHGILTISGTAHRQPGATGPLDGRVDVDLIGPDGMMLDKSLHCHLQPNTIPADPGQVAAYAPTPFGYVPPTGSTLRARYVTAKDAVLEDLKDGDLDYNGNGGHSGSDVPRSQENGAAPANPSGGGNGT